MLNELTVGAPHFAHTASCGKSTAGITERRSGMRTVWVDNSICGLDNTVKDHCIWMAQGSTTFETSTLPTSIQPLQIMQIYHVATSLSAAIIPICDRSRQVSRHVNIYVYATQWRGSLHKISICTYSAQISIYTHNQTSVKQLRQSHYRS